MKMKSLRVVLQNNPVEASAPCRIDMGGTLDLSTFYLPLQRWEPCTFNAAINLRTRVRLHAFDKGRIKISSRGFQNVVADSRQAPYDHPLGLMMAIADYFAADGIHIEIDSASPPRSALGGSSVAAVALIWAFGKLLQQLGHPMPGRREVALLAHAIEQSVAGVPCGLQDQLAAVYGGVNNWHWQGKGGGAVFIREALYPKRTCRQFSKQIMVAYCGEPHASKDINGTWVRDFMAGRHRRIWHQIIDCARQFSEALRRKQLSLAKSIMNRETDLRCQMTPEVLDDIGRQLVDSARRRECGVRFTGAGGGGCMWAIGTPDQLAALRPDWQEILARHSAAGILETAIDVDGVL